MATAPATPVYNTNAPGTPGVLQGNLLAKKAYDNAVARIGQQRNSALLSAGYGANFDANGGYSNLHVDPNNAFGGLQAMLRNQAGEDQQAQFMNQERGLRGGLANQSLSNLKYEHGAQTGQFGNQLIDSLSGFEDQQRSASQDYQNTLWELQQQAARDAIAAQQFNAGQLSPSPTDYNYPAPSGPYPGPSSGASSGGPVGPTPTPQAWQQTVAKVTKVTPPPAIVQKVIAKILAFNKPLTSTTRRAI